MAEGIFVPTAVQVVLGDITTLEVDAVVNAANTRMLGGGGVDGAIHRAAGPGLLAECRGVPEVEPGVRCPEGEARLTGGHDMPCTWIIHTVGPVWSGGRAGEAETLASCYRRSLELAAKVGAASVAFPAISTGVYGYPIELAARIAVTELCLGAARHDMIRRIVACCFDTRTLEVYERLLRT